MNRWVLAVATMLPALAFAQVPGTIGYQGRLLDALGTPVIGVQNLKFAIFDDATGGNQLWCETQLVAMTDGYYAVSLGSGSACTPPTTTPLASAFAGASRFLEIAVGTATLTPRQAFASVPFALVAGSMAGGGASFIQNQSAASQTASFKITGSGALGGATGSAQLHVAGSGAASGTGTAVVTKDSSSVSGVGTNFTAELAAGDVITIPSIPQSARVTAVTGASGNNVVTVDVNWTASTTGPFAIQKPVARFHSAGSAAAALMVNAQGNVGIGTNTPGAALDVNGNTRGIHNWFNAGWLGACRPLNDFRQAGWTNVLIGASLFTDSSCATDGNNPHECHFFCAAMCLNGGGSDCAKCCGIRTYYTNGLVNILLLK